MITLDPILATALVSGIVAGLVSGSLSPIIVSTGNTFYAVEVTHAILAGGVVGGLVSALGIGVPSVAVAFAVVIGFSIMVSWLAGRGYSQDVSVGVAAYTAAVLVALSSYLYVRVDPTGAGSIVGLLVGSLFLVTPADLAVLSAVGFMVLAVLYVFWREIAYTSFDAEWAEASGVRVSWYRLLLFLLVSLTGAILTYTVGVLLAHIVLVAPGVMASRLSRTLGGMMLLGSIGTVATMAAGVMVSWVTGVPPAASVGLFIAAGYGVARIGLGLVGGRAK